MSIYAHRREIRDLATVVLEDLQRALSIPSQAWDIPDMVMESDITMDCLNRKSKKVSR